MTSTVRNMDLKGVPLRRTLQLLLKQLDLIYFVDDGILCITSQESEDQIDMGSGRACLNHLPRSWKRSTKPSAESLP